MNYVEDIKRFIPSCEQERTDKKIILQTIEQYNHNILTRNNEIVHITSTGFTVNEAFDKILMVYHNIYNSWAWTGGHADGEENLLAVAKREVQEETGIVNITSFDDKVISLDILTTKNHIKKGKYVPPHLHFNVSYLFIAQETGGIRIKPDENSGVKWIPIDQIDSYVEEKEMLPVYHKLIKKIRQFKI